MTADPDRARDPALPFHDALPPHRNARGFHNPAGSPRARGSARDWLRFFRELSLGPAHVRRPPIPAGHVLDADTALAGFETSAGQDTLTWLGHACFLIRIGGRTVLTDPYLTTWASPVPGFGPRRYAGTGIPLNRLPPIDLILLSHNHYDHLDAPALRQLAQRNPDAGFAVPLGLAESIRSLGFAKVRELDWGDQYSHLGLDITALPAVHFSSRTPFDRNRTLWCGFALSDGRQRIYFAGDTGWGPVFEPVGACYGPFDLGLVPIGAYDPRVLMRAVHADPEEAVRIGRALGAKRLAAMHWGTIALTTEPAFEPPKRFKAAALAAGYTEDEAWVMRIGETRRY